MKTDNNFMDDYEDNDLITPFIQNIIGEEHDILVCRHELGDGKHLIIIDDAIKLDLDAWTTKEDFKETLLNAFGLEEYVYVSVCYGSDDVEKYNIYASDDNEAWVQIEEFKHNFENGILLSIKAWNKLIKGE